MKDDLEISLDLPSPFWDALDDEDLGLAQCILMEAMTTSSQGVAEHQENNSFLTTRLPWCELHDVKWDLEHVSGCLILLCFDPLKPNHLVVPFYLDFIGQTFRLDLPSV